MVVTPGTAALTVHLPCKTCQRHPVSHKISSRQATITVRDPVGVAGHEADIAGDTYGVSDGYRSEEHTSELQSHHDLVCRLLLEKKKKQTHTKQTHNQHIT